MPTESRILHSDVQPRNVDPTDVVLAGELHQRVELARKVVQVPWMVNVVLLKWANELLARTTEPRAVLRRVDVRSILNPRNRAFSVLHHIPVLLLKRNEVGVFFKRSFLLQRDSSELLKSVSNLVLLEGLALAELLERLEARGQLEVGSEVEGERRLERWRGYNFDASVLGDVCVLNQILNVYQWLRKLALRWPVGLHLFYLAQRVRRVHRFNQ